MIYISIGYICIIATYLKKNNKKIQSYPFDWCITPLDNLFTILDGNFEIMKNKEMYFTKEQTNQVMLNLAKTCFLISI